MKVVEEIALRFKVPFGMVVSGPSSSGKTTFVLQLLEHYQKMFNPAPQQIIYCYGQYGKHISRLEQMGVLTHDGYPTEELLTSQPRPFLLVIDDLMLTIDQKILDAIFTRQSHHMNFGVIFLTQNMFEKKLRVARMNSQYLILLKMPSAALQVRTLGSQLFPGQAKDFVNVYQQVTKNPYSYLLIDLHPTTDPILRLRSSIFPGDLTVVHTL